ncbi:hypothetical protein KIS4809_2285 [Bacillus sp. ZZV12-4809]|nr:hypothetical protein KIS4809_2285 [Bacillus sp. ZZV12-4809]
MCDLVIAKKQDSHSNIVTEMVHSELFDKGFLDLYGRDS